MPGGRCQFACGALGESAAISRCTATITRFNNSALWNDPTTDQTHVGRAYMLDDNGVDQFDNTFFQVTPAGAIAMDS